MSEDLKSRVKLLCGVYDPETLPGEPFGEKVLDFLGALAKAVRGILPFAAKEMTWE